MSGNNSEAFSTCGNAQEDEGNSALIESLRNLIQQLDLFENSKSFPTNNNDSQPTSSGSTGYATVYSAASAFYKATLSDSAEDVFRTIDEFGTVKIYASLMNFRKQSSGPGLEYGSIDAQMYRQHIQLPPEIPEDLAHEFLCFYCHCYVGVQVGGTSPPDLPSRFETLAGSAHY